MISKQIYNNQYLAFQPCFSKIFLINSIHCCEIHARGWRLEARGPIMLQKQQTVQSLNLTFNSVLFWRYIARHPLVPAVACFHYWCCSPRVPLTIVTSSWLRHNAAASTGTQSSQSTPNHPLLRLLADRIPDLGRQSILFINHC